MINAISLRLRNVIFNTSTNILFLRCGGSVGDLPEVLTYLAFTPGQILPSSKINAINGLVCYRPVSKNIRTSNADVSTQRTGLHLRVKKNAL